MLSQVSICSQGTGVPQPQFQRSQILTGRGTPTEVLSSRWGGDRGWRGGGKMEMRPVTGPILLRPVSGPAGAPQPGQDTPG